MPLYKFSTNDIFRNRIKTHPRTSFVINKGRVVYNSEIPAVGNLDSAHTDGDPATIPANIKHMPSGFLSMYEMNVDRDETGHTYDASTEAGVRAMIYPFITKQGSLSAFKTVSTNSFQSFAYGDTMSGSYPLSSSIAVEHHRDVSEVPTGATARRHINSLRNTFEH